MNAEGTLMAADKGLKSFAAMFAFHRSQLRVSSAFIGVLLSAFIGVPKDFGITSSSAASISLRDDLDRTVELKGPARRIVTLAPFLTELVYTAGAGERVVGVSVYSDYPPEAKKLPQVGTSAGFDVARIAALRPDLLLLWQESFPSEGVGRISPFGAGGFVGRTRTPHDVPRLLRAIGRPPGPDG